MTVKNVEKLEKSRVAVTVEGGAEVLIEKGGGI